MSHLKQPLNRIIAYANRRLCPYREVVWIIGDGRSGTNWLSQIVNHDQRSRFMYEPFHPRKISAMKDVRMFQYMRPESQDRRFQRLTSAVLSGDFYDPRVMHAYRPRLYRRLLVKDIFAHLFAQWASRQFPRIKIVLLMRHPFSVALSKQQRSTWSWMTEPQDFFQQPRLMADHLDPFREILRAADTYFEKQIAIWFAIHYVWNRQFDPENFHLVLYEELCEFPDRAASKLARFIGREGQAAEDMMRAASESRQPQRPPSSPQAWQPHLNSQQVGRGMSILKAFELDRLYGVAPIPLCKSADVFPRH